MAYDYKGLTFSKGIWHFSFASDFFDVANNAPLSNPIRWMSGRRSSRKTDPEHAEAWSGTANYEKANHLAVYGWKEGTERATRMAERLSNELVETLARPEVHYEVEGDMFDMGKVIDEEPECWMKWHEGSDHSEQMDSAKGPVKIVLNCTVSAGISKDIIEIRGCAAMALAIIFEAAQRPVMIEVVSPISDANVKEVSVVLKDYYDPLQIDVAAYCLIHPSFFRRHVFSVWEVMDINDQWGYGIPTDTVRDKGDIYIGEAKWGHKEWASVDAAERWVKKQLEMQGIRFGEK